MPATPQDRDGRALLDEWRDDGLEPIDLPSGRAVRVRRGSLVELAAAGLMPFPLTAIASGSTGTESDTDVGFAVFRATLQTAAAAIRYLRRGDGAWIPVKVDVETFLELPLPDRSAITRVALGEEAVEVAAGLATFRDEPAGGAPGADGADLRPAAVDDARPGRAARGARPRPGARG